MVPTIIKQYNNIIIDGITKNDIEILTYLKSVNGASLSSLANIIRVKPVTYLYEIEPYLIYCKLIDIKNKRYLSIKGKELLEKLC